MDQSTEALLGEVLDMRFRRAAEVDDAPAEKGNHVPSAAGGFHLRAEARIRVAGSLVLRFCAFALGVGQLVQLVPRN
jgi:hypothetical protein